MIAVGSYHRRVSDPEKMAQLIIDRKGRINRISYELCVLSQLRDCFRTKESSHLELK